MNSESIGHPTRQIAFEPATIQAETAVQQSPAEERHRFHEDLIFPNFLETFRSLIFVMVVALFVLTFIAQPFRIPSESMERTLLVGDFLLVNKTAFGPAGEWGWLLPYHRVRRGNIVVFRFPLDPSEYVVKRVIGVPGDRVRLQSGLVYINGQRQAEPYATFEGSYPDVFRDDFPLSSAISPGVDTRWWMEMRTGVRNGELLVPPGSYFVLGDNRNFSRDSRYWGFVPQDSIVGRPFLIYFSLREPSTTDGAMLPDDRLGHEKSALDAILAFARWSRMFRVVR